VKGHQLRAGHHLLLWMSIFSDALDDLKYKLIDTSSSITSVQTAIKTELAKLYVENLVLPPKIASKFPDVMQCWTNYEPRSDHSTSLSTALINSTLEGTYEKNLKWLPEWHGVIADRLHYGDGGWLKAQMTGYKDYKVVLAGSNSSGPVSLFFTSKQIGKLMICDLAQEWKRLKPKGTYCKLLACPPNVYMTKVLSSVKPDHFAFNPGAFYSIKSLRTTSILLHGLFRGIRRTHL
jgi:hypothetical protein